MAENKESISINNEKQQRIAKIRKRRKAIVVSGFAAILLIILIILIYVFLFRIRSYKVNFKEDVPYTQEEIQEALTGFTGKNLFSVSTEDVAPVLESKLPYVTGVTVSKKLPDTLSVTVYCSKEVFAVELSDGLYAVTDGNLKVLKIDSLIPDGATLVQGRKSSQGYEIGQQLSFSSDVGDDEILAALCEIASEAEDSGFENISMIDVNNSDAIYMIYDGRIVIRLGNTSNMASKISLTKKSIDEENKTSPQGYGELNVTVSGKAVFAPKDYKDIEELALYEGKINPEDTPEETTDEDAEGDESEEESTEADETAAEETTESTGIQ